MTYRGRIKPEDHPVKGKYANAFNKFCPKKVEVNEATMEEAIKYGHFLKRSEEDIAEAIDIYKTLGNETFCSPEEDPVDQQEQQNNDYPPSMPQKTILPPYIHLHPGNWIVSPLL